MHEHPYEKIYNIEQFCVFWYITIYDNEISFIKTLTNQVHNIFHNETNILIFVIKNFQKY